MPSLLEIEVALHAFYQALGKTFDIGDIDGTEIEAMEAALKAAEAVRAEEAERRRK